MRIEIRRSDKGWRFECYHGGCVVTGTARTKFSAWQSAKAESAYLVMRIARQGRAVW